jgi:hypothetical protein
MTLGTWRTSSAGGHPLRDDRHPPGLASSCADSTTDKDSSQKHVNGNGFRLRRGAQDAPIGKQVFRSTALGSRQWKRKD